MVIKHLINGTNRYRLRFFKKRILVCLKSDFQFHFYSFFFSQGELLIDVEDKLNRKKYVSSLDIEIVRQTNL